ncbi:putative acetyltransferase [Catenulispora sp. GAS73]|uniref:GNAT family N-acetyltransferase n=1 Tax=Catenulispora sp. GAS73 TaxID=3156269 RepID=UPI00351960C7
MTIEIRTVSDAEFPAWSDAVSVGFFHFDHRGSDGLRRIFWEKEIGQGRVFGAFDGELVVGTHGTFHTELTVPGGAPLGVGAVTAVTVQQTHRRRGILKELMTRGLRQSAERGEAASILIPSEWPIYGRFGYGRATEEVTTRIDARAAGLLAPLPGTVELVSAERWCEEMPSVYDRIRATTPGAIERSPQWWRRSAGLLQAQGQPVDKSTLFAVCRDEDGVARGYASYSAERAPQNVGFTKNMTLNASVLAETPAIWARLMQFLWEQDWIVRVEVDLQPNDDTWRLFMTNPRAAWQADRYDTLWLRILDAEAALSARTYGHEAKLVLAVHDTDGYADGVYALEAGPDGATVRRTTESPNLSLPVQSLGSLLLGGYAPSLLAAANLVTEETPGALGVADRMFKTAGQPFAPTWF